MNLTVLIFFLIALFNIVLPKSKIVLVISIIFLVVLSTNNDLIADRFVYRAMYASIGNYSDVDIGFRFLVNAFNFFNIPFFWFIVFLLTTSFYLIFRVVVKITQYHGWVLAMYLIFPFFNDIAQLRSFLGMGLLINGVYYLLFSEKRNVKLFFIFIALSTLIHYSYIFFVLLFILEKYLFKDTFNQQDYKKLINIIVFFEFFLLLSVPVILFLTQNYLPKIGNRLLHYFSGSTSIQTRVLLVGLFVATFYLVISFIIKYNNDSFKKHSQSFYIINVLLLLIFPFVFFSIEFLRIYRSLFIFNYILYSNNLKELVHDIKYIMRNLIESSGQGINSMGNVFINKLGTVFLFLVFLLYFNLLYFYFDKLLIGESILYPFFHNNLIFN